MNIIADPPTVVLLEADATTTSDLQQTTDLTWATAPGFTFLIDGLLMVESADSGAAAPQVGITWPDGCTNGVGEIIAVSTATAEVCAAGNVAAPFHLDATSLPGSGSWPVRIRATFVAGAEATGSFVVTVASSDGTTEVAVKAGSWIRASAIG